MVIPSIIVSECPPNASESLCLLCHSDHETVFCSVLGTSQAFSLARKSKLCFVCLKYSFLSAHFCAPDNICLETGCAIKNTHSTRICGSLSPDSCVMVAADRESINRIQTFFLWVPDKETGKLVPLRCMGDTGASHSFLNSAKAEQIRHNSFGSHKIQIKSFQHTSSSRVGIVRARVFGTPDFLSKSFNIQFLTAPNVGSRDRSFELSPDQKRFIQKHNLTLCDEEAAQDGFLKIDAIIGQDLYYDIVDGEVLRLPGGLKLVKTIFNSFMLAGSSTNNDSVKINQISTSIPSSTSVFATYDTLSDEEERYHLDQFSNLDVLGISPEENVHPVMQHFENSVKHVEGRYQVELPKKLPQLKKLPTNFGQALTRTIGGMRKRRQRRDQTEHRKYNEAIEGYIESGILQKVAELGSVEEVEHTFAADPTAYDHVGTISKDTRVCYLPHFSVYKASSGKLRVVYDAKARPRKGTLSLNDCLETGPNMMNALVRILMKFRKKKFAAKADVEKAFLQIGIHPDDRDLLRILWIIDGKVVVYRFTRLPFGLNCSPFLLAAVMKYTLFSSHIDEEEKYQILASFYVDDSMYSESTLSKLFSRRENSIKAFQDAGMPLREWTSNDPSARKKFSREENNRELPSSEVSLGIFWDLDSDLIRINDARAMEYRGKYPKTKRGVWRYVHKLYDPLGFIAPFTLLAKILATEVSQRVKAWDTPIPEDLNQKISKWTEDFDHLKDIWFVRHNEVDDPIWKKLVGFCDASGEGIAACIYVTTSDGKQVESHLVKANTHLPTASMKTNIPRLELIGALMLSQLMTEVRSVYPEVGLDDVYYFTDSKIVLHWIHTGASHWDTFIANRIITIRKLTEIVQWRHVTGGDHGSNPADIPSRGCSLVKLKDNLLWKHGPEFIRYVSSSDLRDPKSTVTDFNDAKALGIPGEQISKARVNLKTVIAERLVKHISPKSLISKVINPAEYETYHKLMTVTELVLLFINNLDKKRTKRLNSPSLLAHLAFDSEPRTEAELMWIRATQRIHFPKMHLLIDNPDAAVAPFIKNTFYQHGVICDPEREVLCCSTRFQNSDLPRGSVYPILLPKESIFTKLYIRNAHEKVGHRGAPQTLSYIRKQFWILKGRTAVQSIISRCNFCKREEGKAFHLPPHPPLPDFRARKCRPFSATGLDYTGPFKLSNLEGAGSSKVYVLLLTCAATRAVHLEVTRSMDVGDLVLALERFFSFRGIPNHFESDNGSNFVRYNKELQFALKSKQMQSLFDTSKISWNFYTAKTPHMGGFIEKLNDLFKRVLRKTFGKTKLNFEQFRSSISYTMAVLNDRPLSFVYTKNNSEGLPLTPSMLTHGHDTLEPPHITFDAINDDISKNLGDQFVQLEKLKNKLWETWREEYVTGLFEWHARTRKSGRLRVPKLNDVCLIHDGSSKVVVKRREWKLGRVIGFKEPRRDSHLRQVRVKTLSKTGRPSYLNRSPADLYPLEVDAHQVNDPLIESYVPYTGEPSEVKPEKLPPFWTQPIKLPDTLTYGKKGKSKKKPPKIVTPPRRPVVKVPDILRDMSNSGEALGISELFDHGEEVDIPRSERDPDWQPPKRKPVPLSTRTLRPRAPGRGTVIPGRSNV